MTRYSETVCGIGRELAVVRSRGKADGGDVFSFT